MTTVTCRTWRCSRLPETLLSNTIAVFEWDIDRDEVPLVHSIEDPLRSKIRGGCEVESVLIGRHPYRFRSRAMVQRTPVRATVEDLARAEGKAELIAGRIVPLMPTGREPNRIAG